MKRCSRGPNLTRPYATHVNVTEKRLEHMTCYVCCCPRTYAPAMKTCEGVQVQTPRVLDLSSEGKCARRFTPPPPPGQIFRMSEKLQKHIRIK
jgi:hypothetical protein